ncbi:MAG TPA: serine hydrolase domain-containing protein [Bryobacteraceae bacterium]|nr:serine hydrolase domain-containing protein [Bryobacteraceae bacterium]
MSRAAGVAALRLPIAALVACAAALAAGAPARLGPAKVQAVERAIEAEKSRLHIPGLSVAVGEDLQLAWSRGFGLSDLEDNAAATPETLFRIASISKPVTAVAVMQLVERGKLDLDAPIQRYVPSFPEKPWPLTLRHLLSHLGGIRHYQSFAEVYSTRHYADLTEALQIFSADPLLSEPGAAFHYSTYGYVLLGAAVEAASGLPFAEYLKRNIFAPAHMTATSVDDVFAVLPHRARGYRRTTNGDIANCGLFDASNKVPGGGLVSTPEDLVRFVIALEKGDLVSAATRTLMFTRARTSAGEQVPYGLGWSVFERNGGLWVAHSGAQPGASTFLLAKPAGDVMVVVLANLEGVDLGPLAGRLADLVAPGAH